MTHISIKSGNTKIDQSITFSLKTWPISCSHRIFWGVSGSHRVLRGSHSLVWPLVGTLANAPTGRRLLAPQSARLSACSSAPTPTTTIRGLTESILWFRHFPCSPSRKRWKECNTFKVENEGKQFGRNYLPVRQTVKNWWNRVLSGCCLWLISKVAIICDRFWTFFWEAVIFAIGSPFQMKNNRLTGPMGPEAKVHSQTTKPPNSRH